LFFHRSGDLQLGNERAVTRIKKIYTHKGKSEDQDTKLIVSRQKA